MPNGLAPVQWALHMKQNWEQHYAAMLDANGAIWVLMTALN
jgi:hypothetical protein